MKINTVFKQMGQRLACGLLFALSGFAAYAGDGTSFDSPIELTSTGDVICSPDGDNNPVYYSYTATMDGALIIPSHGSYDDVVVYDADQIEVGTVYYDFAKVPVFKDAVYYIKWQGNTNSSFDWTLNERAAVEGDFCDKPIAAAPENKYSSSENWDVYYTYTAEKDGLLVLSDGTQNATVSVYPDCVSYSIASDNSGELTINVTAGTSYIIGWYSADVTDLLWTLKVRTTFAGETCANALAINFQKNEFSETISGAKYYSYTPAVDEYVRVSDGAVKGTIAYLADCSSSDNILDVNMEGELVVKMTAGYEYLFRYTTSEEATLSFKTVPVAGESCEAATLVQAGTVQEYPLYDGYRYYTYTATQDGIVDIKSDLLNQTVLAYNNCTDEMGYASDTSHVQYPVTKGETMIIAFAVSVDSAFNWTLSIRDAKEGEVCSKALALTAGPNKIDASPNGAYYVYTAQSDAFLRVSSNDVQMISGSGCATDAVWTDSPTSSIEMDVKTGTQYYFLIQSSAPAQLEVSEMAHYAGESCEKPLVISDAKQQYDSVLNSADVALKYYTFTPEKAGVVVVAPTATDASSFVINVLDACEGNTVASSTNEGLKFIAQANKMYVIVWSKDSNDAIEWYLKLRDVAAGENCSTPIVITQQGVQYFASSKLLDTAYYAYTVEKDGLLLLNDSSKYNAVDVLTACGGESTTEYGSQSLSVKQGEKYIIKWQNLGTTAFDWTLENRALYPGETCQNPIVLTKAGDVEYNYAGNLSKLYYTYTATQDGLLSFADSSYKNSVVILDSCNDEDLDGYSSQYSIEVSKGKTYLFAWNNYSYSSFKWTLSERAIVAGELCSKPIQIASAGVVHFTNGVNLPTQYYAFTAQTTGLLILEDTTTILQCSVLDGCNGAYLASGYGSVKAEVTKGKTYIVEIYSYIGNEMNWKISNRAVKDGELCSNAISVQKNVANTFAPASVLDSKYYTYTAEQDGVIALQIEADKYAGVAVALSCDGDALGENEEGTLVVKVTKGQKYLIGWLAYDTEPFKWTLENRAASATDFCDKPVITEVVSNIGCVGSKYGSIDLSVSGGAGPYTYRWSNTSTKEDLYDIEAGTYKVTVTDSLMCSATKEFEVKPAGTLTVTATVTNPQCAKADGEIKLTVSGGASPYSYKWSDENTESEIMNLKAGSYSVTVSDSKSCTAVKTIALNNNAAPAITIEKQTNVQCGKQNGAISVVVVGGREPYTYSWSDKTNADATKEDRTGLSAGSYTLTVSDANGCTASFSTQISNPVIEQPQISLVTVGSEGKNLVVWLREKTDAIKYYTIYRESTEAGKYDSVGFVNYNDLSVYRDKDADADEIAWRYKISATDNCGSKTAQSREYKTMHLQRGLGDKGQINLVWDSYEGSEYKTYIVYAMNEHDSLVEIRRLPTSINRYTVTKPLAKAKGYYVAIDLPSLIDPTKFKADVGPFSQSMSNMAEASLVSAPSVESALFVVFPNPTTSFVTVALPIESIAHVSVFDNGGLQVASLGAVQTVDLSKYSAGTYTIQVTTTGNAIVKQSVVKQ